jgi:excisionase family DNA binding protein
MEILDYFYTAGQAAKLLNVNRITVWRWIRQGKLDTQQVGREVLIPKWEADLLRTKRQARKSAT